MTVPDPHALGLPWLVADLGGTNARFAWVADPARGPEHVRSLPVREHAGLEQAIRHYLGTSADVLGSEAPRRAALAMAADIGGDAVRFTNSAWGFSRAGLQAALALEALLLLNDFEALALSLPRLGASQQRVFGQTDRTITAVVAPMGVLGPGTGLGVGSVVPSASGWVALPGEGGHVTLAAADDFEAELLRYTRRTFAHVSAERYLSGVGLPTLHEAVAAVMGTPVAAPLAAPAIIERGLSGSDVACAQTIDVFCAMLGGVAGNLAVTIGARGGVFIGGGIAPRLGERFFASRFRERFEAKGRFADYLARIPTALITDTQAALSGAALALEQLRA